MNSDTESEDGWEVLYGRLWTRVGDHVDTIACSDDNPTRTVANESSLAEEPDTLWAKMKICQSGELRISSCLSHVDHIKMGKTSIVARVGWAICGDVLSVKEREMNMLRVTSFWTIAAVHHNTVKSRKSAEVQQWHKTMVITFLGLSSVMSATISNISWYLKKIIGSECYWGIFVNGDVRWQTDICHREKPLQITWRIFVDQSACVSFNTLTSCHSEVMFEFWLCREQMKIHIWVKNFEHRLENRIQFMTTKCWRHNNHIEWQIQANPVEKNLIGLLQLHRNEFHKAIISPRIFQKSNRRRTLKYCTSLWFDAREK
jgi:hypothetical protein